MALSAVVLPVRGQTTACDRPRATCPAVASLLARREGFGRHAVGGLGGAFVLVTSDMDDGPGSLRAILRAGNGPRWVRFARDMTIILKSKVLIPSETTIDGRGRRVVLLDYGLDVREGVRDVIVTHLIIDGEFRTEEVAFNFTGGARDIWADHLDLSRFIDRLINVKTGATNVTLSWIKFHDHNKVMLLNNTQSDNLFMYWDRDSVSRVTIHHCWFVNTVQRNPRAILGEYDIYNNLLQDWDFYGMSFGLEARAWVAGNIFDNRRARPCREPDHFDTIEHVEKTYCDSIPAAPARTALPNGDADRQGYDTTRTTFGYTHDYRAFLRVVDNLYLDDARPALVDYQPWRVTPPSYCTSYERPTPALAASIRREAGDTPFEGISPGRCHA